LMTMSKKTPQPKTMANYYQKLAMVFWKAENRLFHAAALLRLFQLSRELRKTITPDELQRMASHVLVATLAIPLPSAHPEYDRFIETDKSPLEKAQRLAVLLGLTQPPSRQTLLRDIVSITLLFIDELISNLHFVSHRFVQTFSNWHCPNFKICIDGSKWNTIH
jgi:translation initiation factor 3 subunit A